MTNSRVKVLTLSLLLLGCGRSDSPFSPGDQRLFGDWGGDQAEVNVNGTSTFVVIGCMTGQFGGSIPLDQNGRFSVNGTWNLSIGPIRLDGNMPAQMSGQVTGNSLTFAVAVNDTIAKQVSSLGPKTVVFGKQGTGTVCPV